ncbi:MAG: M20/M25/M40 family metallo-hydrolase [Chloroflexi bacterium]|nr:M20/M25/M40 family metallo-hydrolase [Chloroflexota bacterium]
MLVNAALNWDQIQREATDILSRYIRLDTSNPPGGESKAVEFLARLLAGDGIESRTYQSAPGRENLVARLRSSDTQSPPLLLLHHMDVVAANPQLWSKPPFDGLIRDGHVWGRGAIDDKGLGAIHLMAMLLLKRAAVPLKRDLIFMAVADEEEGGSLGTRWMLDNQPAEVQCEYVWDEGGVGSVGITGNRPVFTISVQEKRSVVVRLKAYGRGGHGSVASGGPLDRLVRALHGIQGFAGDVRFNSVTRRFLEQLAETQTSLAGWIMRHPEAPISGSILKRQLRKIPALDAMLRDTVTVTVVQAGVNSNVAPDEAEAVLDVRLLPDTPLENFLQRLNRAINDESIEVTATDSPPSPPPSSTDTAMFQAMRRAVLTQVPEALVASMQTPVATDSRFFRERGINAYGLIPVVLTPEELGSIHGVDERISVQGLVQGIKIALDVLWDMCA